MFRLPWDAIYAIYSLRYIAGNSPKWTSVRELHQRAAIPPRYGSRILQGLRRAGFIEGMRGKGYRMATAPSQISILRVLQERADPSWACPDPCPMRMTGCKSTGDCALESAWRAGVKAMSSALSDITLESIPVDARGRPVCPMATREQIQVPPNSGEGDDSNSKRPDRDVPWD